MKAPSTAADGAFMSTRTGLDSERWLAGILHAMPTELLAEGRDGLHRRRLVLAGDETGEDRCADRRNRHCTRESLFDRPPAFAGVLDVACDLLELGVLLESTDEELEQPGPHDGSALPGLEGSGNVLDDVLALVEELVAFGVGLHQGVLDAVVHHLGVVPGTDLAGVNEALVARTLGTKRVEDGHGALDLLGLAADHEAVAVLVAPDSTRDTGVDVLDALRRELLGVTEVFGETGVAALDDEVARLEVLTELGDDRVRDGAGGNHDPDDAGGGDGGDEVGDGCRIRHGRILVEAGHFDVVFAKAGAHVAAHSAEADEPDVHGGAFCCERVVSAEAGWAAAGSGSCQRRPGHG